MPEYKTVYFAPDGKWFLAREDCQKYEDEVKAAEYLLPVLVDAFRNGQAVIDNSMLIAEHLLKRYEERYGWKPETVKELPNEQQVIPAEGSQPE